MRWKRASFKILIINFIFLFVLSIQVLAQEKSVAISSFKKIVSKAEKFFAVKQKFLAKEEFPDSLTGIVAKIWECDCVKLSFDIKISDSLISPFLGYIYLDLKERNNEKCGNVKIGEDYYGWDNEVDPIKNAESEICYRSFIPEIETYRLNFAYQNNKWVVKGAYNVSQGRSWGRLSRAFGISTPPPHLPLSRPEAIKFNRKWTELFK